MCFEIKESDGPGGFFSLASGRMALTKPVEKRRVGRPRKHEISGSDAEPREHILKTAARLFGDKGIAEVSMAEIAQQSGQQGHLAPRGPARRALEHQPGRGQEQDEPHQARRRHVVAQEAVRPPVDLVGR